VGASQILPYIKGLSKNGTRFFVISFEKPDRLDEGRQRVQTELDESGIVWWTFGYTKRPPVLSTMFDLRKMKKAAKQICNENKVDFIHARSYISGLAAHHIFKKKQIPFLFDMRGFWADERIDGGIWNLRNPIYKVIYRFFKRKEKQMLVDAQQVVSLTFAGKDVLTNDWGIDSSKIEVIPCAADYNHFARPENAVLDRARTKYNLPKIVGKTLIYTGSTGTWYMLREMADFYGIFRNHFPQSRFVLCVNEVSEAVKAIEQQFPNEVHVFERVARNEMPQMLSLADFSIMFIKPSFSKKASSPIKLAESLAVGVPAICNVGVGDLGSVENDGFGLLIRNFSPEAYSAICQKIAAIPFESTNLRSASSEMYELSNNIARYQNLYSKMI
jgi:glycosyltransferase involved in cell wall biosynthesis